MAERERHVGTALVCTNHLFMWTATELVAIELAEELIERGIRVTLAATLADRTFLESIFGSDIAIYEIGQELDLDAFDLVYAQHGVFQVLLDNALRSGGSVARSVLVWNHLSPFEPLEARGAFVAAKLADLIFANSPETASELARYGAPFATAELWPNPAPACFATVPEAGPNGHRLLIVSNHATPEIVEARRLLEAQGLEVRWIGQGDDRVRVTPVHLAQADAVLTIGKTVQYALRAGRAIYCYGPHGGPGWLDAENVGAAQQKNFSGRSHPDRKSGAQIADEIANRLAQGIPRSEPPCSPEAAGMVLEQQVDRLLARVISALDDPDRRCRREAALAHPDTRSAIAREANLCRASQKFYAKFRALAPQPTYPAHGDRTRFCVPLQTRLFPKNRGATNYVITGLAARCDMVVLSDHVAPKIHVHRKPGRPAPRHIFLSMRAPFLALKAFVEDVLPTSRLRSFWCPGLRISLCRSRPITAGAVTTMPSR